MACGCPVVACHDSSVPEVAGDAAIYVGDDDAAALATAIAALDDEATRTHWRDLGCAHARQFDWASTATIVEELMREVARADSPKQ